MDEEKVSILALFKTLYKKKKFIYTSTGIFWGLGILIYFISPREYTSSATILSESQGSSLGGLSSLASLAGVNLNASGLNSDNSLNSTLYEEVLKSTPFLNKLVHQTFYFPSEKKSMPLGVYLSDYSRQSLFMTISRLPMRVVGIFKKGDAGTSAHNKQAAGDTSNQEVLFDNAVLNVAGSDKFAISELKRRFTYTVDIRTGLVDLTLDMQDQEAAATVMQALVAKLSSYIINYQTQKERRMLDFTEQQVSKAQKRYTDAQLSLASFRDRNRNVLLNLSKTEDDRLQAQLNLEFNVYNSLLQQREQLRLKVANETPSISVIEPPQIQTTPSKPNFLLITIITLFLGFFLGSTYVLLKNTVIEITK